LNRRRLIAVFIPLWKLFNNRKASLGKAGALKD